MYESMGTNGNGSEDAHKREESFDAYRKKQLRKLDRLQAAAAAVGARR